MMKKNISVLDYIIRIFFTNINITLAKI
jgi:hypothetical protein